MFDITQKALKCGTLIGSMIILTELWNHIFGNVSFMNVSVVKRKKDKINKNE